MGTYPCVACTAYPLPWLDQKVLPRLAKYYDIIRSPFFSFVLAPLTQVHLVIAFITWSVELEACIPSCIRPEVRIPLDQRILCSDCCKKM